MSSGASHCRLSDVSRIRSEGAEEADQSAIVFRYGQIVVRDLTRDASQGRERMYVNQGVAVIVPMNEDNCGVSILDQPAACDVLQYTRKLG